MRALMYSVCNYDTPKKNIQILSYQFLKIFKSCKILYLTDLIYYKEYLNSGFSLSVKSENSMFSGTTYLLPSAAF